ncbi:MAG: hypothetical protein WCL30_00020 [Pseudomonadota bacterium]
MQTAITQIENLKQQNPAIAASYPVENVATQVIGNFDHGLKGIEIAPKQEASTDRLEISAKVQALLMSVSVAIARLQNKMAAGGSSPELAALEQCYSSLQGNALSLLTALSDPSAVFTLESLKSQQAGLNSQLARFNSDSNKEDEREVGLNILNSHPLVKTLDAQIAGLELVREQGFVLMDNLRQANNGRVDLNSAIIVAAVMNNGGNAGEALQNAIDQMSAQAAAHEEALRASGASADYIARMREFMQEEIQTRAERLYSASLNIRESLSHGYGVAREKIGEYYQDWVVEPSQKFMDNYPEYLANAKQYLGDRYDAVHDNVTGIAGSLQNNLDSMRDAIANSNSLEYLSDRFGSLKDASANLVDAFGRTAQAPLSENLENLKHTRQALVDLLVGNAQNIQEVAAALNIEVHQLATQVAIFQADHGVEVQPVKAAVAAVASAFGIDVGGWHLPPH